jgi:L-ascorbate metabolism protein UlaG (beta-lactamase superfamily)
MLVEWYGQSAFRLSDGDVAVVIDPFGAMEGRRWDYPPLPAETADLLLVTHDHRDHNAVDAVPGAPWTLRASEGSHATPVGEVVGVASEHDDAGGTERGPNTIFVLTVGGVRVAHLGDLGQEALRDEQVAAIGPVDLAIVPVGGGPTIGGATAARTAAVLGARWAVPMHYRTERIDFLEPVDAFVAAVPAVHRLDVPRFDTADLPAADGLLGVVPAAP